MASYRLHKVEIYRRREQWSWRLRAPNGRIIATAHESYKRRSHAEKMIDKILGLDAFDCSFSIITDDENDGDD